MLVRIQATERIQLESTKELDQGELDRLKETVESGVCGLCSDDFYLDSVQDVIDGEVDCDDVMISVKGDDGKWRDA